MSRIFPPVCAAILLVLCIGESALSERTEQKPAKATDFVALLKQGRDSGKWPAGFVIRMEAHLFHAVPADPDERDELKNQGIDVNQRLDEVWEFSDGRVHKVKMKLDESETQRVYERVESAAFNSRAICRELLEGNIESLGEEQGPGAHHFAGTGYDLGERSIVFLQDGKIIDFVGESCAIAGFSEKDAKAFSRLYDSLSSKARQAFRKKGSQ